MKAPGRRVTMLLISILVVSLPIRANEQPTDEYRTAMKTLEAASAILRHHARMVEPGGDFGYTWVENDAATLKAGFEQTLKFWETKNVKNAVRLAQNAVSDAAVLERAARAGTTTAWLQASRRLLPAANRATTRIGITTGRFVRDPTPGHLDPQP